MIQNCRVYRSAQFLNTDHRLIAVTLKLQRKSRRMAPSQPRLDVGKLKDERVAEEFANKLSGDLGGLNALGNPEELWSAFKTGISTSLMLLVDVLELTIGRKKIWSLKGHWKTLTGVAGPGLKAELSYS